MRNTPQLTYEEFIVYLTQEENRIKINRLLDDLVLHFQKKKKTLVSIDEIVSYLKEEETKVTSPSEKKGEEKEGKSITPYTQLQKEEIAIQQQLEKSYSDFLTLTRHNGTHAASPALTEKDILNITIKPSKYIRNQHKKSQNPIGKLLINIVEKMDASRVEFKGDLSDFIAHRRKIVTLTHAKACQFIAQHLSDQVNQILFPAALEARGAKGLEMPRRKKELYEEKLDLLKKLVDYCINQNWQTHTYNLGFFVFSGGKSGSDYKHPTSQRIPQLVADILGLANDGIIKLEIDENKSDDDKEKKYFCKIQKSVPVPYSNQDKRDIILSLDELANKIRAKAAELLPADHKRKQPTKNHYLNLVKLLNGEELALTSASAEVKRSV